VLDGVTKAPIIVPTIRARRGGVVRATTTTTAPWGIYQIESGLAAGTYTVIASASGYNPQGRNRIAVTAGATRYVNFFLQPQP